ncbi:6-carboxytetrahydropterin synthase [Streptomyces misionensis]|uniref:6-carboxytetrahydropterin synthase n=1 Tax=Streptomyces misionensis TaxID=67331 RepID=UPI00340B39E0
MSEQWRIGKLFRFEATRVLDGRHDGHSFTAEAVLAAKTLDDVGFVVDFGRLAPLKQHIASVLDHQFLNTQVSDASDPGLAAYLTAWARAHLPPDIGSALAEVRIHAGRPTPPADECAVTFEATHHLVGLPDGHPCGRRHGHSYLVTVNAAGGEPAQVPQALRQHIEDVLDGVVLEEVLPFTPTSERLSAYLAEFLGPQKGRPFAVRVSETETSWAEYRREAA